MNRTQLLLSKLAEECSEVAQMAIKTSQFGMDDVWTTLTNRKRLHEELDDLMAIVDMLNEESGLSYARNEKRILSKKERVNYFAEYSIKLGLVTHNNNERI